MKSLRQPRAGQSTLFALAAWFISAAPPLFAADAPADVPAPTVSSPAPLASIKAYLPQGDVRLRDAAGHLTLLSDGQSLSDKHTILTGNESSVLLGFSDGTLMLVMPKSKITIFEFKILTNKTNIPNSIYFLGQYLSDAEINVGVMRGSILFETPSPKGLLEINVQLEVNNRPYGCAVFARGAIVSFDLISGEPGTADALLLMNLGGHVAFQTYPGPAIDTIPFEVPSGIKLSFSQGLGYGLPLSANEAHTSIKNFFEKINNARSVAGLSPLPIPPNPKVPTDMLPHATYSESEIRAMMDRLIPPQMRVFPNDPTRDW